MGWPEEAQSARQEIARLGRTLVLEFVHRWADSTRKGSRIRCALGYPFQRSQERHCRGVARSGGQSAPVRAVPLRQTQGRLSAGAKLRSVVFGGSTESWAMKLLAGSLRRRDMRIFVDDAALHHEAYFFKSSNVGQRIGIHSDDVGIFARFNCSHILSPPD